MTRVVYRHQLAGDFLAPGQAERIHQTALRILHEVGLAVALESAREEMAARGFRVCRERVHFEPHVVEECLAELRRRHMEGAQPAAQGQADDGKLYLSTGVYAHHVHDLDADRIVPYTTEKLIEMTKLVDVLAERGVHSPAPGYPLDVPPPLQPIAKYRVGALYSHEGEWPVDPISAASIPYVMEMAEALGHPMHSLPVYVFSPLRLAGESLLVAMRFRHRLESIHVSDMPSVGGTAPVLPFGALAMAAAEVLGAFVTLSVVTGLPVDFGIGLHAFDLRFGSMVFGSPEAYLYGQLNAEISEFYAPWRWRQRGQAAAGIHVRANFPGAQAAAEKASLMTAGALIGARWFDGAGILALDEVFSAEQLLVDCEIKDQVQRLTAGLELGEEAADWVEEVRRGVEGSFMALDSTLDHYRSTYWHPQLFDRGFLASQGFEGRCQLAERARDAVRAYVARHEYELDRARRREVDRIWQRAVHDLV
jgi:trimethylamine--corrinoid protein Co-methyltransferase